MASSASAAAAETNPPPADSATVSAKKVMEMAKKVGFPLDQAEALIGFFTHLRADDRLSILSISKQEMFRVLRQVVPCLGCCTRVEAYMTEIIEEAQQAAQSPQDDSFYAEWLIIGDYVQVNGEGVIRAVDECIDDGVAAAELFVQGCTILAALGTGSSALERDHQPDPADQFLIREMVDSCNPHSSSSQGRGGRGNGANVPYRCVLHSHKQLSGHLWRLACDSLLDQIEDGLHLDEFAEVLQFDKNALHSALLTYIKKRRLCNSCRKRILEQFDKLADGSHDLMPDELMTKPGTLIPTGRQAEKRKEAESGRDPADVGKGPGADGEASRLNIQVATDVFDCLRYSHESQKILVPVDVDVVDNLLHLAESEAALQQCRQHADTDDLAQEELLVCMGVLLKAKLQDFWRATKIEEVVKIRALHTITHSFHQKVNDWLNAQAPDLVREIRDAEFTFEEKEEEKARKKRERKRERKKKINQLKAQAKKGEIPAVGVSASGNGSESAYSQEKAEPSTNQSPATKQSEPHTHPLPVESAAAAAEEEKGLLATPRHCITSMDSEVEKRLRETCEFSCSSSDEGSFGGVFDNRDFSSSRQEAKRVANMKLENLLSMCRAWKGVNIGFLGSEAALLLNSKHE